MQPWKDPRTVKILVGATILVIVALWFLTGDLPLLTQAAFEPASEDKTKAFDLWALLGPMLTQACLIVGGAAVGLFSGLWSLILGAVDTRTAAVQPVDEFRSAAQDLVQAASDNDSAGLEAARVKIRKPTAMGLHQEAIEAGDLDRADELMAELRLLIAPGTASKTRKAVTGGK